jgi:hypothetical protein
VKTSLPIYPFDVASSALPAQKISFTKSRLFLAGICHRQSTFWMLLVLQLISFSATPCTIFVLTDRDHTWFFNNEDYLIPTTFLWFRASGKDHLGCAFVGFDNGMAQGGLNEKGLAFDWVAGPLENWTADESLARVQGSSSERMLETCSTVPEAIAFYQKFYEPAFVYAKILIADKTGASVVIGGHNGELHFEKSVQSRGFGVGQQILAKRLTSAGKPALAEGISILQACKQQGIYATKYSNVFDLRSGEIHLIGFSENRPDISINLRTELSKGSHHYEIPSIHEQLSQACRMLLPRMERLLSDGYQAVPDSNPELTKKVKRVIQETLESKLNKNDYTSAYWKQIALHPLYGEIIGLGIKNLGALQKVTPVKHSSKPDIYTNLYVIEFEKTKIVQQFVFDNHGRISLVQMEKAEQKKRGREIPWYEPLIQWISYFFNSLMRLGDGLTW